MENVSKLKRNKQWIALALGPLLSISILMIPGGIAGLSPLGQKALAACAWVVVWWCMEPIPPGAAGLIGVVIYGIYGIMTPVEGFKAIANPNNLIVLGSMIIIGLWKESNLISRYAYWCLSLKIIKGSPVRLLISFGIAAAFLSSFTPNIPVCILFAAIAMEIAKSLEANPGNSLIKTLGLAAGLAPILGGLTTPIGATPNLIAMGVVQSTLNREVQFWEWTALGLPVALCMIVVMAWLLKVVYKVKIGPDCPAIPREMILEKLKRYGKITYHEHVAIIVMAIALVLWSIGTPVANWMGWKSIKPMLSAPAVSLAISMLLLVIPLCRDRETGKIQFCMSWEAAVKSVDWSMLIFMGTAILFGEILVKGGVDKWSAGIIQGFLGGLSGSVVWFALMLIGCFLSQVIANVAVCTLFIPITASLAQVYGLDPVLTCVTVGMVCNVGILFPFSSIPVAVAMLGTKEYVGTCDWVKFGSLILVAMCIITMIIGSILGPIIFVK